MVKFSFQNAKDCRCDKENAMIQGGMISIGCRACNEKIGIKVVAVLKK